MSSLGSWFRTNMKKHQAPDPENNHYHLVKTFISGFRFISCDCLTVALESPESLLGVVRFGAECAQERCFLC